MAKKINRIVKEVNTRKKAVVIDKTWQHPGHTKEKLSIPFAGKTDEAVARQKEKRVRMLQEKNYILIEDELDISTLFGNKSSMWMSRLYDGSMVFMVWKFSQILKLTDDKQEREELLDALTEYQAQEIMNCIIESKIHKMALFINDFGEEEHTRNGQLAKRKEDGSPVYNVKDNIVKGIERANIGVHDLCLNTIKHAMKIKNIEIHKEKKLTKGKK